MPHPESAQQLIDALRIPTLPASVSKVRDLLMRDDVGVVEVAAVIALDPPLTAAVLRTANSVQIGSNEPKVSVQAATAVIGLRAVAAVVLRAGILAAYEHLHDVGDFSVRDIWLHSIRVGSAAEHLAKLCRTRSSDFMPQDYYTCGLLHDIGEIILFDNFGAEYARLLRERSPTTSQVQAEADGLLGLDHTAIGSLAASMWHLPAPIPDIVKFHHRPMDKPSVSEAATVIACADEIVQLVDAKPDAKPDVLATELTVIPQGIKPTALIATIVHARAGRASAEA